MIQQQSPTKESTSSSPVIHYTPTKNGGKVNILSRGDDVYLSQLPSNQLFNCRLQQEKIFARKLFITKNEVIHLIQSKSNSERYIVLSSYNLSALTKVKFKRNDGKCNLIFNNNELISCYVENVNDCILFIQKVMSIVGIQGTPTNKNVPKTTNKLETAEKMFDATLALAEQFNISPNIDIVLHIMDLLRESAERFSEANNDKYQDVINFIKKFLQKNEVVQLLDIESKNRRNSTDNITVFPKVTEEVPVSNINDNNTEKKMRKLSLKDVDVDTSSMEKLLQKSNDFDDDNDDDYRIRKKSSADSADAELRNMLGNMTDEFATLLSTFSNPTNLSSDDAFDEGVETFDLRDLDLLINDKDDMSNSFIYKA